jgi:putative spermidine/putrescine transport system substrate-binding protein
MSLVCWSPLSGFLNLKPRFYPKGDPKMNTRRILNWQFGVLGVMVLAALLAGCARPGSNVDPNATSTEDMEALIAAAQAEGQLTAIALPDDWCNYGEVISTFEQKYDIDVTVLTPDAGSGDELAAVEAYRDTQQGDGPDVIDVGFSFGPQAKQNALIAPYKVATWDTIPEAMKDAEGYWYGDYYGVLSFEVNRDFVAQLPQDWADLLKPEYKNQVALAGDPRASNQAIMAVYAAALANGGGLGDARPGLDFFKALNEAGNLVPYIASSEMVASGQSPIVIRWDYLALGDRDSLAGSANIEVIVPRSGLLGGLYLQAISAYAQHPNAARLWMEFLYSDEGQLLWLKGYCHPARFDDMVSRQVIPPDLMAALPPAELYSQALFPTLTQQDAAKTMITSGWDVIVGVDIVRP